MQDGWQQDPFGTHEERMFQDGQPTALVRDGGVGSVDPPPSPASAGSVSTGPPPSPPPPPAGWYTPDRADPSFLRYWDGQGWTSRTSQKVGPPPEIPSEPVPPAAPRSHEQPSPPMSRRSTNPRRRRMAIGALVGAIVAVGVAAGALVFTGSSPQAASDSVAQTPTTQGAAAPTYLPTTAPATTTSYTTTTTSPPLGSASNPAPVGSAVQVTGYSYDFSITLAQAEPLLSADQTGYTELALEFVVNDSGQQPVSEDIFSDLKVYNTSGQGFTGDFGAEPGPALGPSFPSGLINVQPGGTASGWIIVDVTIQSRVASVTFTPGGAFSSGSSATWTTL